MVGRDVPDVPPAPARRASGRRSRHRHRGAEGLRPAQAADARSPAQAGRRLEAVSIRRVLVSLAEPRQPGRGRFASPARRHQGHAANDARCCTALRRSSSPPRSSRCRLGSPRRPRRRQARKWDVAAELGPTTKLAFDTSEGTWMNVDVSPDGKRIVFDLLGDIYMMPIGGSGAAPGDAADERARLRHAAALQSRRQAHRVRSDRDGLWNIWTMDADGQGPEAGLARAALVRQQPDLVARRRVHLRAAALRQGAVARRRRDLDVPRGGRVRRPAGHREQRLAEGRRRARRFARRPLPLLQQGRHARA